MRVYDTLTGSHVELPPPPEPIGMYVCGPTVYQRAHIGNARPFVVFSWLRNWLRERGYEVTFVHNITDVNDKIYDAAPGKSAELARDATAWYLEDTSDLGLDMPTEMPLATESMPEIVTLIQELIGAGYAYPAGGDVYYRVTRFAEYGRLSRQRIDQVEQGEEPSSLKEDPRDFALWKANKPGEDTWWESPWGRGRPGWHIECSAMAEKTLGAEFWIHGGGLDLVFPHHENEIAQSRAVGRPYARIWMHNGMLELGGAEMHKSLGNDVTLRNVLDTWGRETTLLYFLTGHWHGPIDFSDAAMSAARAQLDSFKAAAYWDDPVTPQDSDAEWGRFAAVLDDDFNTPAALAILHEWRSARYLALLRRGLELFGISAPTSVRIVMGDDGYILRSIGEPPESVRKLITDRHRARNERDWNRADELRDAIAEIGWSVEDEPDGYRLVPRP